MSDFIVSENRFAIAFDAEMLWDQIHLFFDRNVRNIAEPEQNSSRTIVWNLIGWYFGLHLMNQNSIGGNYFE